MLGILFLVDAGGLESAYAKASADAPSTPPMYIGVLCHII